jgi:hypothetical protein
VTWSVVPSTRWNAIVTLVAPAGVGDSANPEGGCGTFDTGPTVVLPHVHVTLSIRPCFQVAVVSPPTAHVTV